MCIICQTISLGAALVTGALPVAVPETQTAQPSAPPPAIAGTTCKTPGQQRTSGGVRFTCAATKTKRVWRRTSAPRTGTGTGTAATTTTTTLPVGYLKPTCGPGVADCPTVSATNPNVAECKITDATPGSGSQGFPRSSRAKPGKPVIEVLVVPVQYAGMSITEAELRTQFEQQFQRTREFFRRNSYGRVTPNFTLESESQWVKLDVTWQQFINSRDQDLRRIVPDIVRMIPRQNLPSFDSIFVVAAGGNSYWGGADLDGTYTHASGEVHSVYYQTGPASESSFEHNLGHTAYYMEDLYLHPYFRTPGADINPFKYDIMSSGDDFSVWNRWLAGFVADSEVRCVSANAAESTHRLVHANNANGEKLAMVPLGSGRALFAEYINNGVHVYALDSNIGHGAGPIKTLGLLQAGQSVTHAGMQVTVSAADSSSVYVKIGR